MSDVGALTFRLFSVRSRIANLPKLRGRSHDCSVRLGTEVAHLADKTCIMLTMQKEYDTEPKFMLTEPDLVRDRVVILIDDVYRTGDTLRDAARVLRSAGARQILGLTVTCAVSAIIPQ